MSSSNKPTSPRRNGPSPVSPQQRSKSSKSSPSTHKSNKSSKSTSKSSSSSSTASFQVLDIGGSELPQILTTLLTEQLLYPSPETTNDGTSTRHIPALLFSDDKGLGMWSKITHLTDYYQTRDEIELLENWGADVVKKMKENSTFMMAPLEELIVVDLGAGDVRKVKPLLRQLDKLSIPITYYALDLSSTSLKAAMDTLSESKFKNITCTGLWGTFTQVLSHLQTLNNKDFTTQTPRLFLSLGSMFGNDFPSPAISLLKTWRDQMQWNDFFLVGMDGTEDMEDIWYSYHDDKGLFEKFVKNGFKGCEKVMGVQFYRSEDWTLTGELASTPYTMHKFVFRANRDVTIPASASTNSESITIHQGERIECYRAFKLGIEEMRSRFQASGLGEVGCWRSQTGRINQYLLKKDYSQEAQAW